MIINESNSGYEIYSNDHYDRSSPMIVMIDDQCWQSSHSNGAIVRHNRTECCIDNCSIFLARSFHTVFFYSIAALWSRFFSRFLEEETFPSNISYKSVVQMYSTLDSQLPRYVERVKYEWNEERRRQLFYFAVGTMLLFIIFFKYCGYYYIVIIQRFIQNILYSDQYSRGRRISMANISKHREFLMFSSDWNSFLFKSHLRFRSLKILVCFLSRLDSSLNLRFFSLV